MAATNASPTLVLENVVKLADPDLKIAMMTKYDPTRPDPLQQASELVAWAQALKDEDKVYKGAGKETVNAVTLGRKCYKCGAGGHIRRDCPEKERNNEGDDSGKVKWSLAGKQTRARQPTKDTGEHAPVDRVGATKDQAAKHFEEFLPWFEKRFECKVRVLRTDGGAEYNNVDEFCKITGVARQKSEAKNQAANGKAERMHRTVMNM
eukprot:jgi/Phyca11/120426/e_gw1.41.246.1